MQGKICHHIIYQFAPWFQNRIGAFAVFALVAQPLLAINVPSVAAMAGSVHDKLVYVGYC